MTGLNNRNKCSKFHLVIYMVLLITCIVTVKTILQTINTSQALGFERDSHRYLRLDLSNVQKSGEESAEDLQDKTEILMVEPAEVEDGSIFAKRQESIGYIHYGLVKDLPFHSARLDSRGLIRIYDYAWTGDKWDDLLESFTICLSTQGTLDRLHWMPELVQSWRGPVSLAILIPSPEEYIGLNLLIHHFRKCYPYFRSHVSIHLALPAQLEYWSLDIDNLQLDLGVTDKYLQNFGNLSCTKSEHVVQDVLTRFQQNTELQTLIESYPQNHMRNLAKQGCGTEWNFATDIDIIPRPDSASALQDFILTDYVQECTKCAFVVPTFELANNQSYPESKEKLVQLKNANLARSFHKKVFSRAQKATNYVRWLKTNLIEKPINVSHNADKKSLKYYEPFYISPSSIPEFQERFIGYGFTRSSQIQEALSEGWKFQVLSPIFAIHWGLQNPETLLNPGNERVTRRKQTYFNGRIFKQFMKELDLKRKLQKQEEYARKHGTTPDFRKF